MATASISSSSTSTTAPTHVPADWLTERIAFLRELADKSGDPGIAAGLDSAALVLETELSSFRNGGQS